MKALKILAAIVLWAWQLPQNVLGFIVLLTYAIRGKVLKAENLGGFTNAFYLTDIQKDNFDQAVSLGDFILIERQCSSVTLLHEAGHAKQSKLLGPLYLLVIGLPSFAWAIAYRMNPKVDYYSFYTERWANKLGGACILFEER